MVSSHCYGSFVYLVFCVNLLLGSYPIRVSSVPLSTNSRWIVDDADGSRVKFACVNWAGHLEPMLPEGLNKQPVDKITSQIKSMGFNCVRLTWATFMFTDPSLNNQTISQTFTSLGLQDSLEGIKENNPEFVSITHVQAFEAVVDSLGKNGVMVILDNHLSKPGWCCNPFDGNGFWGDEYFDPDVWAEGLRIVASTFKNKSQVVAMSLRNEPRGLTENTDDWFKYMQMGANIVNSENPHVLVIHSGLMSDTKLDFLSSRQLIENFTNKLVYEIHWYSFTNFAEYTFGNLNDICASITDGVQKNGGFLVELNQPYTGPLFLSEFGIDVSGSSLNDNRFINCFFSFAAGGDFDWAYWALQGSYYLRDGQEGYVESFGILDAQWDQPRNQAFLQRLQTLQQPFIQNVGNAEKKSYQILFHPKSGSCLSRSQNQTLTLGSCHDGEEHVGWTINEDGEIMATSGASKYNCVGAIGEGKVPMMQECGKYFWSNQTSQSNLQLQSQVNGNGPLVCLDDSDSIEEIILTNNCKCTYGDLLCLGQQSDDPSSQWFKIVTCSS